MRPEEMRAALVEAMAKAMCCTGGCQASEADPRCFAMPASGDDAETCMAALESKLSEIGAKITVREPSEATLTAGVEASWHQRVSLIYTAMHDAAPLTPWHTEASER